MNIGVVDMRGERCKEGSYILIREMMEIHFKIEVSGKGEKGKSSKRPWKINIFLQFNI